MTACNTHCNERRRDCPGRVILALRTRVWNIDVPPYVHNVCQSILKVEQHAQLDAGKDGIRDARLCDHAENNGHGHVARERAITRRRPAPFEMFDSAIRPGGGDFENRSIIEEDAACVDHDIVRSSENAARKAWNDVQDDVKGLRNDE